MSQQSRLAVEITKGDDFINIWVDANNNGVRDDDDVNIFVSKCGNLFAESPTFKQTLDAHLKLRLQEASVALMTAGHDSMKEEEICDIALELVIHACRAPEMVAEPTIVQETPMYIAPVQAEQPAQAAAPAWYDAPAAAQTAPQPEYSEAGFPIYRPQA